MIQNEFKMIFNAFRFPSRTLSMFSNALEMICNAFKHFQNALKWKNGSTEFSSSLVFPNRVTNEASGMGKKHSESMNLRGPLLKD